MMDRERPSPEGREAQETLLYQRLQEAQDRIDALWTEVEAALGESPARAKTERELLDSGKLAELDRAYKAAGAIFDEWMRSARSDV